MIYDAGPPTADDADAIERTLLGGSLRQRAVPRPKRRLEVAVKATDLRFLSEPIMVGHYEQDPIAGPEGLIDRELLDGDLSERHSLGPVRRAARHCHGGAARAQRARAAARQHERRRGHRPGLLRRRAEPGSI